MNKYEVRFLIYLEIGFTFFWVVLFIVFSSWIWGNRNVEANKLRIYEYTNDYSPTNTVIVCDENVIYQNGSFIDLNKYEMNKKTLRHKILYNDRFFFVYYKSLLGSDPIPYRIYSVNNEGNDYTLHYSSLNCIQDAFAYNNSFYIKDSENYFLSFNVVQDIISIISQDDYLSSYEEYIESTQYYSINKKTIIDKEGNTHNIKSFYKLLRESKVYPITRKLLYLRANIVQVKDKILIVYSFNHKAKILFEYDLKQEKIDYLLSFESNKIDNLSYICAKL